MVFYERRVPRLKKWENLSASKIISGLKNKKTGNRGTVKKNNIF